MEPQALVDPASFLWDGPEEGPRFAFAHGAGAPMDAPFMDRVAQAMGAAGLRVCRFEFPYMAARRETGRRRPPNPAKTLRAAWHEVVRAIATEAEPPFRSVWIGGKSMGGRFATMVADELGVAGVVCFGYPFHPSGKPEKLRVDHLADLATPTLILQGDRDPMGTVDEVGSYDLAATVRVEWFEDGNHDLMPRHKSGHTATGHQTTAARRAAAFVLGDEPPVGSP